MCPKVPTRVVASKRYFVNQHSQKKSHVTFEIRNKKLRVQAIAVSLFSVNCIALYEVKR